MKRLQTGEIIGEYRITGFLGAGGMGEVYSGVHAKLGRPAAIKVLGEAATSDATFKARFFNEACLQANLHHPNIAALYDFNEKDDQLFIFMELVDGECLEDAVKRRAFTIEETLRIFASIVEAIGYLHRNEILHRDIKSQNVKLTSGGTAKLLDFGIAKDSSNQHGLTQTGGVIGTPHYLAPEQLDGAPASPQTDIWALGVLLYEMLTGDTPFKGDTLASLVLQITQAKFAAPEDINPGVPREASKIVRRCLEKDAAKRFQTAEELLQDVNNFINKEQKATKIAGLKKSFGFVPKNDVPAFSPPDQFNQGYSVERYETGDETKAEDFSYSSPSPKKSLFIPVAIGSSIAVVLLFTAIGIGTWAMSGGGVENKNSSTITFSKSQTGNKNAVTPSSDAERMQVQVDTIEGEAEVFRSGQMIGKTPLDLSGSGGETIDLMLRRAGFEDRNVQIEVSSGKKVYTFSMKKK